MASTHTALTNEISTLITRHMETLGQFVPVATYTAGSAPDAIVGCWERLNQICQYSPEGTTFELYQEACECHDHVRSFLSAVNQVVDADFQDTYLGHILQNAKTWRLTAAAEFKLSMSDVWAFIAPACPDHLEAMGDGVFEAKWWLPVPVMDIEILKRTEGVEIVGEPFEPRGLSGGLALRFSLTLDGRDKPSSQFRVQ